MRYVKEWIQRNKLITNLFIFIVLIQILYWLFSYQIIHAMYKEESIDFLNNMLQGRTINSLDFYLERANKFYLVYNIIFISSILGLSFFLKEVRRTKLFWALAKKEFKLFKLKLFENLKLIVLSFTLFLFFYCLYASLGILLTPNYKEFDFFGADVREWLSFEWSRFHKGSHPILILLLAPFGFLRTFSPPLPEAVLAILLNSFFGASAVVLASLFFWNLTKRYVATYLLSILFGLSMSQLIFSSLPESYALASCSIITTYILLLISLRRQRVNLIYWIFAGVFSFGITITNFAQTLICFVITVFYIKKRDRVVTVLEYIGAIVLVEFLLSIIQKNVFPNAQYFFISDMVSAEMNYVKTSLFNEPFLILKEILKHFFLVNFVSSSPLPKTPAIYSGSIPLGFFGRSLDYSFIGLIGMVFWIGFFLTSIYRNAISCFIENRNFKCAFLLAVSFSILFNMALHSVFGAEEMFLYTCNFTFPVLLLSVNESIIKKTYFKIFLVLLIFVMGVNNLTIVSQLFKVPQAATHLIWRF